MTQTLAAGEVRVCAVDEVPVDEGRRAMVAGRPIALFRTDSGFFALDDTCTHMGGPLADGLVADETVACPLHDRRFELATGRAVGHGCGGVSPYPAHERDGEVFVTLPVPRGAGETEPAAGVT